MQPNNCRAGMGMLILHDACVLRKVSFGMKEAAGPDPDGSCPVIRNDFRTEYRCFCQLLFFLFPFQPVPVVS